MTPHAEYKLEKFRAEQPEFFDEEGNSYRSVYPYSMMERMLELINILEKELIGRRIKFNQ